MMFPKFKVEFQMGLGKLMMATDLGLFQPRSAVSVYYTVIDIHLILGGVILVSCLKH